jgi:hypothetical protein
MVGCKEFYIAEGTEGFSNTVVTVARDLRRTAVEIYNKNI